MQLNNDETVLVATLVRHRLEEYCLTPRETEIVWLMAGGMANKEIAAHCHIALQTVKDHLKHVYAKVGAHQRTALLARLIGTSLEGPQGRPLSRQQRTLTGHL